MIVDIQLDFLVFRLSCIYILFHIFCCYYFSSLPTFLYLPHSHSIFGYNTISLFVVCHISLCNVSIASIIQETTCLPQYISLSMESILLYLQKLILLILTTLLLIIWRIVPISLPTHITWFILWLVTTVTYLCPLQ